MDFLHPGKKRKRQIELFLGYALMAIALVILTTIVVVMNLGYDIDRNTGAIIQKGLLTVDSHPVSSEVFINGVSRGHTSNRFDLPAGSYSVELKRDGYQTWSHDINLEGGSIEQLVYPFLFPQKLITKSIGSFSSMPSMASVSPDRHWLVVNLPDKAGSFSLIDLNDPKNPTSTLALPQDALTASSEHHFTAVEWASDNDNLLIRHDFKDGSEFIMLNRSKPTSSFNLTKLFPNQPATQIALRDKKANQFYFYNQPNSTLVSASSSDLSVSVLLKHVTQFKPYQNDTIIYVGGETSDKNITELHLWHSGQDFLLRTLPVSDNYLIDSAEFENNFYLVAGSSADGKIYFYKNPLAVLSGHPAKTPNAFKLLVVKAAHFVSFSAISRFIGVQDGNTFAVYDLETGRQFKYTTGLNIDPNQKALWMDGHRLSLVSQDKSVVFDFDNTNRHILERANAAFGVIFNRDYDAMYSLYPEANNNAFSLLRTELHVPPIGQ